MNLRAPSLERTKIAARLREAAADARVEAGRLLLDALRAAALAEEIESEAPPPLEEVLDRGRSLFRRRGKGCVELAELRETRALERRESNVALSPRGLIVALAAGKGGR